jgi:hypothetical protein
MSIALTNLDDRRWADLVDEGRGLIPFYSPEWTDHNFSDPGITLIELFAWLAEMDIYGLNRIPDSHLRKFISLVGVRPKPPQPSIAALSLSLKADQSNPALRIARTIEFDGVDPFGQRTRFRSLHSLFAIDTELNSVQRKDADGFHDLSNRLRRLEEIEPFGSDPTIGSEFYLGFSHPLPIGVPASVLFLTEPLDAGQGLRQRLADERRAAAQRCDASVLKCRPSIEPIGPTDNSDVGSLRWDRSSHHSVRLSWEFFSEKGRWQKLTTSREIRSSEVFDDTRALTLNGRVLIKLPAGMNPTTLGKVKQPLYYLRARITAGAYDAAPRLSYCAVNGVFVEQAAPAGTLQWTIAAGAQIKGAPPRLGHSSWLKLRFNNKGQITRLGFGAFKDALRLVVLDYQASQPGQSGLLKVEVARIGAGDGKPNLLLQLPEAPALTSALEVFTIENGHVRAWSRTDDFDNSGRADAHFSLEPMRGLVSFGNGERGRVVPKDAPVFVRYDSTRARAGDLPADRITTLADSPHNRAILGGSFGVLETRLDRIENSLPTAGGTDAETLTHAIGRALESVNKTGRAVTLKDYEELARETPGTQLARVSARANSHPSFPCLNAQGIISVVALPYLPLDRPSPSAGLLAAVNDYLSPRRVIGTRVEVVGPVYKEVIVQAEVKALPHANRLEVGQRIIASLNRFFHPLQGGPDGSGWPLGRDVFRSEVLQVIDETPGVDHVNSLALASGCGEPQCGNLCLAANELVAAGAHQIEVV